MTSQWHCTPAAWSPIRKSCSGQCRDEPNRLASLGRRIRSPCQCSTGSLAWSPRSQGSSLGSTTQWTAPMPTSRCNGQQLQREADADDRFPLSVPFHQPIKFALKPGQVGSGMVSPRFGRRILIVIPRSSAMVPIKSAPSRSTCCTTSKVGAFLVTAADNAGRGATPLLVRR